MTGRHARRRPDIADYMAAGDPSDLPGRPARYDPALAAQARAGLTEQARRQRITIPPDPPTGRYKRRCGHTITGPFNEVCVCNEPRGHGLPHRNADGTEWWPGSRWARLRAWLTERFTPVKED